MRAYLIAIAFLVSLCGNASAQQMAAAPTAVAGEWHGVIEDYTFGENRRTLNVVGKNSCTWQEIGKNAAVQPCMTTENGLTLTTRHSKTVVTFDGKLLRGTFTLNDGKSFKITMARSAADLPNWHQAAGSTGSSIGLQPFLGKWHGTQAVFCGTQTVREYFLDITPASGNTVNVHYRRPPMCTEGIDWRTTATLKNGELEFFGNTKRFSITMNGSMLDLKVYWNTAGSGSRATQTEGATLNRKP